MAKQIYIRGGVRVNSGRATSLRCGRSWEIPDAPAQAVQHTAPEGNRAGPIRHFDASRQVRDAVAWAFADAGLTVSEIAGPGTGFVSGSFYGTLEFSDRLRRRVDDSGPRCMKPTDFSIATQSYPMAALSIEFQCTGPTTAFVSGTTAGLEAICFAQHMMNNALCERMIVVGFSLLGETTRYHYRMLVADQNKQDCIVALVLDTVGADGALAVLGRSLSGFCPTKPVADLSEIATLGDEIVTDGADDSSLVVLSAIFSALLKPGKGNSFVVSSTDPLGAYSALGLISLVKQHDKEIAA